MFFLNHFFCIISKWEPPDIRIKAPQLLLTVYWLLTMFDINLESYNKEQHKTFTFC